MNRRAFHALHASLQTDVIRAIRLMALSVKVRPAGARTRTDDKEKAA